jgi:trk system potassium uptake protein TrkH
MKEILKKIKGRYFSQPEAVLLSNFATVILVGWFLLTLPISHYPGKVSSIDALFTSGSAVCVTGLVVVDTPTAFTLFGQIVIVCLIQVGGLGLMTFAALIFRIMRTRITNKSRMILEDTFFQDNFASEFLKLFKQILLITFFIELTGIICLFFFIRNDANVFHRFFSSIFHTVSAYCNAGFSIYSDNLVATKNNWPFMITIMSLIVLGGIGYSTLIELYNRATHSKDIKERIRWTLNTRVVLRMTAALIIFGALFILLFGLTEEEKTISEKAMGSLFQSVTARTAGFNSINIGKMPDSSLIIIMVLMFIGGSPGGTAGGIKTTTTVVLFANIIAGVKRRSEVNIFGRRIPNEVLQRAVVLVSLAALWNLIGAIILSISEQNGSYGLIDLLFEQLSAFGTVGLSTGVTPTLTNIGKLWIILTMYIGRVGPLTVALWFAESDRSQIRYPKERLMIG